MVHTWVVLVADTVPRRRGDSGPHVPGAPPERRSASCRMSTVPECVSRRSLLIAGGAGLGAVPLAACRRGADVPELTGVGPGDVVVLLGDVPVAGVHAISLDGRRV